MFSPDKSFKQKKICEGGGGLKSEMVENFKQLEERNLDQSVNITVS